MSSLLAMLLIIDLVMRSRLLGLRFLLFFVVLDLVIHDVAILLFRRLRLIRRWHHHLDERLVLVRLDGIAQFAGAPQRHTDLQ